MEEERKDKKVLRGAAGSLCEGQVERAEDELENDFTGWISPFQAFSTFNLQASPSSSNLPFFITPSRSIFTPLQASESSKASSDSSPDTQESMASSSTDPADAGNKLQLVIASASALAATNTTLQLDDNDFTSIDGVIEYTKSVPAENRYACQQQIMEGLMEHQQAFADNAERFYEYMKSSKDYELNKITPAEFTQQWAATEANQLIQNLRSVARSGLTLKQTIAITNRLIIKRKIGNASGVPRKLGVISSDLTNISKKNDPARDETPLIEQEIEQYKLRYDILRFAELDDSTPLLEFSPEASPVQVVIPVKGKGKEPAVQPSEEKTLGRILRSRKAKSQSQYRNEYNPLPADLDVIDEDELQRLEDEDLEEALQEDEGDDYEEAEPGTKRKRGTGDTAEKGRYRCSTDVPYAWKEAKFARIFRLANRPAKASDKLGAYRFFYKEPKPYIITDDDAYDILEYLSTSKVLATNVSLDNDTGTLTKPAIVIIPQFSKLFDKTLHIGLCSVSLDAEDDEMAINESFVIRIDEKMWTKKDKEHFGIDWTLVPYQPGDARITTPALPHGASGLAKKLRRTDEISACHRDLLPPPASPSGLPNRYSTVPYPFPATLELMDLSAISDALVRRRRWNSPAVQAEMIMLLKGSYIDTADKIPIIVDDIEPIDATSDDPILSMHYNEDPDKNDSALKPITKDEDNDDDNNDDDNDDNDDDEMNMGRMEIEEIEEDLYRAD
ncbi:hypothetical protein BP6252_03404 [Coleophoma cylindrospora]|uniref:Uncharacterized protein n=1 Tax=Coleophoma cylindrospora TaxID=1849047 RepID=A0A3D8S7M2_9HELO|nr:hypothetical protein BP6252_03404 [Coleophoma cylindrospora]